MKHQYLLEKKLYQDDPNEALSVSININYKLI